jgi:hypothetical protein
MIARTEIGLGKALMSVSWNSIGTGSNCCTVIYLKMTILSYSGWNGRMLQATNPGLRYCQYVHRYSIF